MAYSGLNRERARLAASLRIELERVMMDNVRTSAEVVARIQNWAEAELADRRVALTPGMREQIGRWLDRGYLPPTIAKNLGVSRTAVRKYMAENRWVVEGRKPRQLELWRGSR
jgi:hypothetical protein